MTGFMNNKLANIACNFCVSLARGFAKHDSNKIGNAPLNPSDREHLEIIHQTSLRILFISLVTLYMEENSLLPDSPDFRENNGIYGLRESLYLKSSSLSGLKLAFIKRIRSSIRCIYEGSDGYAPFNARLYDPQNDSNSFILKWKIHDGDLKESLTELFLYWPHPGTGLLSSNPPTINEIINVYSDLLDLELKAAECDCLIFKNRNGAIPLSRAHPSDVKQGKLVPEGEIIHAFEKGKSRRGGTVYTPDDIVDRIVIRTIDPLLEKINSAKPLRILDPACGTGRFLVGALEYLADVNPETDGNPVKNREIERKIISESLFGFDLDEIAVSLAEINLMLKTHRADNPAPDLSGNLVVSDALTGIDSKFIRCLIRNGGNYIEDTCSDSQETFDELSWRPLWKFMLDKNNRKEKIKALSMQYFRFIEFLSNPDDGFEIIARDFCTNPEKLLERINPADNNRHVCMHPEICFPDLFYDENGYKLQKAGFDAIIGNPPYGDILSSDVKDFLAKLGYKSGGGGNNDIFRFFVERSLSFLKPGGMLGFILPNTFLKGRKYRNFRCRIVELSNVEEVVDFDLAKKFKREVFTSLLFLRKKPYPQIQPIFITSKDGTLEKIKIERFNPESNFDDSWLPDGELYSKFAHDGRFKPLDPYFARIGDVGINYQRKDVGWTDRAKSRIADEIFYEGEQEHELDKQFLKGEDIEPFVVKPKTPRWLRHDWRDRVMEGEVVNVNFEWGNYPTRILSRQTGDSVIAAVDNKQFLTGRSVHTTILKDIAYSPYYILALMNSSMMTRIYRELTREKGRPQAQVKLSFLRKLPIRHIDFSQDDKKRSELLEEFKEKIDEDITSLPEYIHSLPVSNKQTAAHDLIALLSFRMETILKENGNRGEESALIRNVIDRLVDVLYGL